MVITVGDVVNATWSPPPAAWLNFTNCSAAAAWLAAYGQLYEDEGSLWDGVSFDIVIGYLGSMIPRNWTKPTDANLLVWYHEKNYFRDNNALLMDMINFPLSKCSAQVCPKLQWEGDPDLTGVGVSTASSNVAQSNLPIKLTCANYNRPSGYDVLLHAGRFRNFILHRSFLG